MKRITNLTLFAASGFAALAAGRIISGLEACSISPTSVLNRLAQKIRVRNGPVVPVFLCSSRFIDKGTTAGL
jgi:hypothetical protein